MGIKVLMVTFVVTFDFDKFSREVHTKTTSMIKES